MNSLVGYGVSSESDSEGDVEDANNSGVGPAEEVGEEASAGKRTRNFLLEPASGSSESDSESLPEEEEPKPPSAPPPHSQKPTSDAAVCRSTLPAPTLGSLTSKRLPPPSLNTRFDSSVFANPFKAQADQRLSVLQKHVPLTMQAKPSQIGGRMVCVSYRKDGRCRFGIKCKFAHDSDLQTPATPIDCHLPLTEDTSASDQARSSTGSCDGGSRNRKQEAKEEESGGQQLKKRRAGLSNTLIPPKRVLKQYAMHKDRKWSNMSR